MKSWTHCLSLAINSFHGDDDLFLAGDGIENGLILTDLASLYCPSRKAFGLMGLGMFCMHRCYRLADTGP